jgi:hypothetical protein
MEPRIYMNTSNTTAQASASAGQVLAAIGIILALAITVPLLGVLMIPGVLVATWMRAHLPEASPVRRVMVRLP